MVADRAGPAALVEGFLPEIDAVTELTVQLQRLEAFHELPGAASVDYDTQAVLLGTSGRVVRELRAAMRDRVASSAKSLSADPDVLQAVDRLPADDGIACVGDSLTADRQSWAEMLEGVLRERRPDVRLINLGRSADTTMDIVRRLTMVLGERRPSLFIVMVGTNDACRNAPLPGEPLTSDAETRRNLGRIAEIVSGRSARLMWVTPPPILEEIVAAFPMFRAVGISFTNDDLARKAQIVRERPEPVVDLWPSFAGVSSKHLFLGDGLHLSAAGQALVARQILLQCLL
jgi:acyl-CoA thioesterase-1